MIKILIADKVPAFSKQVAERLSRKFSLRICENGEQVLELCRLWQPDYILLDLELPLVDGITILKTLYSSGQDIKVLVKTTCIHSEYVMQTLVKYGVNYILPSPCTVTEAVSQLFSLVQNAAMGPENEDDRIASLLLHLGFRYGMSGFVCVCEAIRLMMCDVNLPITKAVYPQVAHACGGNAARVERAIRNAVEKAWRNRDDRIWQYYFPPDRSGTIACPTNGEFLCRMVLCLNKRKAI